MKETSVALLLFVSTIFSSQAFADRTLTDAAITDDVQLAQKLLDAGADINAKLNNDGYTALHICAKNDSIKVATLLVSRGAQVNVEANGAYLPIHIVADWGSFRVGKLLLEHGADLHHKNSEGVTPFLETTSIFNIYFFNRTLALSLFNTIVPLFIEHGALINEQGLNQRTLLYSAVGWEVEPQTIDLLLSLGADPNLSTDDGQTPLSEASFNPAGTELAKVLVAHGAKVNVKDQKGNTPLLTAIRRDCEATVEFLIQHGADLNYQDKSGNALMAAVNTQNLKLVQLLFSKGVDINAKNIGGKTALIYAVLAIYGRKDDVVGQAIVRFLVSNGANVNAQDNLGFAALHYAYYDLALVLLQSGASADPRNADGNTPLFLAVNEFWLVDPYNGERLQRIDLLLAHGASPNTLNKKGEFPLSILASKQNYSAEAVGMANRLVAHGADVNLKPPNSESLLWANIHEYDDERIFTILVEHGADTNVNNVDGDSLLHVAVRLNWVNKAKLLLDHKADVNAHNRKGETSLKLATSPEMRALLIAHGASL